MKKNPILADYQAKEQSAPGRQQEIDEKSMRKEKLAEK